MTGIDVSREPVRGALGAKEAESACELLCDWFAHTSKEVLDRRSSSRPILNLDDATIAALAKDKPIVVP